MNIAIAQSGGPTCAINASLLGVLKEAQKCAEIEKVYGSLNGIEGILKNRLVDLKTLSAEQTELLRQTPATVLGSCRYKLPAASEDAATYETIIARFRQNNIKMFFYIGGNDSMDTVAKLSAYFAEKNVDIQVIGIPKTIDNDLMQTDHTPGFGSAAKYVATTLLEVIRDSSVYSVPAVTVVEIMGRSAGWLTASTCVLRAAGEVAPHLIYLPESDFTAAKFIEDVREKLAQNQSVVVAISEGVEAKDLNTDDCRSGAVDNFGHKYLSGIGKMLENHIRNEIGCKVRSIELNVMQRCSAHLGSLTDINEAELIGAEGLRYAVTTKQSGKMMCFKRVSEQPYQVAIEAVDANLVANREKMFPTEWIVGGNNISDDAILYFLPLIQGELEVTTQNGLPVHCKLDK